MPSEVPAEDGDLPRWVVPLLAILGLVTALSVTVRGPDPFAIAGLIVVLVALVLSAARLVRERGRP